LEAIQNINGAIKSWTIKLAEHVKNAYEISIDNLEGKRAHGILARIGVETYGLSSYACG
jgi:hypothetical protein